MRLRRVEKMGQETSDFPPKRKSGTLQAKGGIKFRIVSLKKKREDGGAAHGGEDGAEDGQLL